jgi:membrane protein YqaA with SNARE-associated domain
MNNMNIYGSKRHDWLYQKNDNLEACQKHCVRKWQLWIMFYSVLTKIN